MTLPSNSDTSEAIDYDALVVAFNQALLHTLRKHSIADSFLDYWVPDADPVLGILGMIDSARIARRNAVVIRFSRQTVPEARVPELERAAKLGARMTIDRTPDYFLLKATGLSTDGEQPGSDASIGGTKARYWTVGGTVAKPLEAPANPGNDLELPEFGDAHPALRAGLKAAFQHLRWEGEPADVADNCMRIVATHDAIRMFLDVEAETQLVKGAGHAGASSPSERVALDRFCTLARGIPLQEVADHVGLKVIDAFVDDDKPPPVRGVLLPANAGTPFQIGPKLARLAYALYRAEAQLDPEPNYYAAAPSDSWQSMQPPGRKARIEAGLRGFLQSEQLYPDDLSLLRLENNKTGHEVRAIVAFSARIETDAKPSILRRLERRLRRDVEHQVEVVADRAKDTSPLRRLS